MTSLNIISERVTHSNVTKISGSARRTFCMILINDLGSNISPLKPTKYLRKIRARESFFFGGGVCMWAIIKCSRNYDDAFIIAIIIINAQQQQQQLGHKNEWMRVCMWNRREKRRHVRCEVSENYIFPTNYYNHLLYTYTNYIDIYTFKRRLSGFM